MIITLNKIKIAPIVLKNKTGLELKTLKKFQILKLPKYIRINIQY